MIRVTHAVMVVTALLGDDAAGGQFNLRQAADTITEVAPDADSMTELAAALGMLGVMLLDKMAAERSEVLSEDVTPQEILAEFAADLASHMT